MTTDSRDVTQALDQALAILPERMDTPAARVLLLAIGLQESRLRHRFQIVQGRPGAKGPARGLLQFERGGGVVGVMSHRATRELARMVCMNRGVPFVAHNIWIALEYDDVLAFALGRLLLFTDPRPLPAIGEVEASWDYYIRNWRPGKPHRHTWDELYEQAVAMVRPQLEV